VVKYENYKRFGSDTSITFGDEVQNPGDATTKQKK
jgi:hypothetical protein